MTQISISYHLTLPQFMTACNAHWKVHKQGARTNLIIGVAGIVLGLAFWPLSSWSLLLLIPGLLLILLVIGRSFLWRRAFLLTRKFAGQISVIFRDESIHVETIDGVSDLKWSIYSGFLDTPDGILLYIAGQTFSVIPNSAFADANEQREFMMLVASKLKREG